MTSLILPNVIVVFSAVLGFIFMLLSIGIYLLGDGDNAEAVIRYFKGSVVLLTMALAGSIAIEFLIAIL